MPRRHELHRPLVERVEQAEEALAGDAEHARHTRGGERAHDRLDAPPVSSRPPMMGIGQLDAIFSSIRTVASRSLGSIISNAVWVYRVGIPTSAVGMPADTNGTPSLP